MFKKDLLKEFSFDLQIKNYSKRTIETYKWIIFLDKEHEISVDIPSLRIKRFVQYQLEIGNKSNYINTIIKSMRAFYGYLVNEEYVSHNVLTKIKLLKEDKVGIKTFTNKEIAKMIEVYDFKSYLNTRNKVIIAMFVDTGIRMMTEFINVQSGWMNKTNIRVFGKVTKWRYVSISLMSRSI